MPVPVPYIPLLVSSSILILTAIGLIIEDTIAYCTLERWVATVLTIFGSGIWSGGFLFLAGIIGLLAGIFSNRGAAVASLMCCILTIMIGWGLCTVFIFGKIVVRGAYKLVDIHVSQVFELNPELTERYTYAHISLFGATFIGSIAQIIACSKMLCDCTSRKKKERTIEAAEVRHVYAALPDNGQPPAYDKEY